MRTRLLTSLLTLASPLLAGPYDGPGGTPGSLAIPMDSPAIIGWASGVASLVRGPAVAGDPLSGFASYGEPAFALGPATADPFDTVSLGDGGSITLTFDQPIRDVPGPDFAVFENGFENMPGAYFLELAFVEVSSNGTDFFRFPAISLTQTTAQVLGFAPLDPTDVHNLAGKHQAGYGTPFDLSTIAGLFPALDANAVTHVRIIDVIGSINPGLGSLDSLGNLINDPFTTPFPTGGFDIEAVAVLQTVVPEPGTVALLAGGAALIVATLRRRSRKF